MRRIERAAWADRLAGCAGSLREWAGNGRPAGQKRPAGSARRNRRDAVCGTAAAHRGFKRPIARGERKTEAGVPVLSVLLVLSVLPVLPVQPVLLVLPVLPVLSVLLVLPVLPVP